MRVEELVGRRIREARERAGMSQPQLGEWLEPLLGRPLPRQAVFAAEQGKRQFTAAELVAFAYVVGCEVSDLFTLPIGEDALELPSGKTLSREELRQAGAAGPANIEQLRAVLGDLVSAAAAMQSDGFRVEQTAKKLHDELDRVLASMGREATT